MSVDAELRAIFKALPPGSTWTITREGLGELLERNGAEDANAIADLTAQHVADELDRAPSTVRTWCGAGRIPGAYRLRGREWRIPRASLRRFLEAEAGDGPTRPDDQDGEDVDLGRWRRHLNKDGEL